MSELIPLNDLSRMSHEHLEAISHVAIDVVRSGSYVSGRNLQKFEDELAEYLGVVGAIGVGNGTDALTLSMLSAGIEPGDVVLTVANAGAYTTVAAKAIGAETVFCDVDAENLLISLQSLNAALKICDAEKIRPKALVVTHLFGLLNPQITEILALARKRGLIVIEDCAQAIGAKSINGHAGSFGDIAAFSFYPTKNLGALGDGGAVTSNDRNLLGRVRALREYGWDGKYNITLSGGRNSRLDELQAAILSFKLKHLDDTNKARRSIYLQYLESLHESFQGFAPVAEENVAHLAVFAAKSSPRDRVIAQFEQMQVSTGIHYPTLDVDQKLELKYRDLVPLPISRKYVESIFTVPLFPEMTKAEVDTVATALSREV
jgi:aminotransferase EvaB